MKTLDSDDDNYERAERLAIQSESTAPESATKFPFGHNADDGPEQVLDGTARPAGGVAEAANPDPFKGKPDGEARRRRGRGSLGLPAKSPIHPLG